MNRRMPNGTSAWCGRTAGVIPPPTRLIRIEYQRWIDSKLVDCAKLSDCYKLADRFRRLR